MLFCFPETFDMPRAFYGEVLESPAPEKRLAAIPQSYVNQGPLKTCRTYEECRLRFIKYLDKLSRLEKSG